jgi:hypothetical protein
VISGANRKTHATMLTRYRKQLQVTAPGIPVFATSNEVLNWSRCQLRHPLCENPSLESISIQDGIQHKAKEIPQQGVTHATIITSDNLHFMMQYTFWKKDLQFIKIAHH